jgi:hypothetical protein
LALLVILGACKADHPIGTVEPDAGSDASRSTSPGPDLSIATPGQTVDVQPLGPLGLVESWTGWIENYQFPSGSDVIKFSFASDPNGRIAGQVVLGSGTPPPPATDPNVGYPPGFSGELLPQMEGLAFSMVAGNLTPNRLRFAFDNLEPWAGWCALQTPYDGSGSFLPNWGSSMIENVCTLFNPDGGTLVVDCGRLNLYLDRICECSTTSCSLRPADGGTVFFDLALSGDTASGSWTWSDSHNVHFTKDP